MGSSPLFTFFQFLKYKLRASGPHQLHSPFLFDLFNKVIKPARFFKISEVEKIRSNLLKDHQLIDVIEFKSNQMERKTISSIGRNSASRRKFSAFLHLLINHQSYESILETGTSLGINTLYLGFSQAEKVVTLEGSTILAEIAKKNFDKASLSHIQLELGNVNQVFQQLLVKNEPDMIFLDADHRGEIVSKQVNTILESDKVPSCVVIHDIYWSKDMNQAWNIIIRDGRIPLTVDIFQAGILFPNLDMEKQHFTLRL